MEVEGLFTPPDQSKSMSWSTFWRRPDEKKLFGAARDWAATEDDWAGTDRMESRLNQAAELAASKVCRTRVDWRRASKTTSRFSKRVRACTPPSWLNWLAVKMVMSPAMNRRSAA